MEGDSGMWGWHIVEGTNHKTIPSKISEPESPLAENGPYCLSYIASRPAYCLTIRFAQEFASGTTIDPEQAIGWVLEHHPTTTLREKHLEILEYTDICLQFSQISLLSLHNQLVLHHLIQVLTGWPCLQIHNFLSQMLSVDHVAMDAVHDFIEATLKLMGSSNSNKLAGCTSTLELVPIGGLLVEHVAVANAEDLGTSVAAFVLILMKEQCNAPLSILGLSLCGSDRHAKPRCQEALDIKSEHVWGSIMHVLGGGGSGMSCNPNNDQAKTILVVLVMGDDMSCLGS
ncbi:hypothetical protein EDC04DRAFT_2599503 [Pisolithus marmoratus]|nr:hypothetical protein EDC04DRAFT_2599503 [Pisolithus marmoratus]